MDINLIHTVVVHCTATYPDQNVGAAVIDQWHRAKGWNGIGYHEVIRRDGTIEHGRVWTRQGAHVKGNNRNTLGFSLEGGIRQVDSVPENNFTEMQFDALHALLRKARDECPALNKICGHRDFSPDLDGDGIIEEFEWLKSCPSFDVAAKLVEWEFVL